MKRTIQLFLLCFLALLMAQHAFAEAAAEDVVYLKNGGIMRGTIIEMTPGRTIKLQTADGNIFVYQMEDVERVAKEPAGGGGPENSRNTLESWYLCFAVGYANTGYPSSLQFDLDRISSMGSHTAVGMDIPAVYWPLGNRHTVLGGSLNAVGDRYEVNSSHIEITQIAAGLSALHFLTGEIGDGLFIRGDIGIASLNVSDSYGTSVSSDAGLGLLLGGGYAIPVSNETRILIQMHFASRTVEGDTYRATSITLGVML